MSFKSKLLLLLQNDNTLSRLLLMGLALASPSLHYLCFYNSYDPLLLRAVVSLLCVAALLCTFTSGKALIAVSQYIAIIAFLAINNCLLLSKNDFAHVYLFSAVTIFIAMTLFCKKRWEFITICFLNLVAIELAYAVSTDPAISIGVLIVLMLTFTFIAWVSFLVVMAYNIKFEKAVNSVMVLNHSLRLNDEKLRDKRKKLNALINSLNDVIFEFDENKICLNTWFRRQEDRIMDPQSCVGKRMAEVFGPEKAKKFDDALDHVITTLQSVSIEFPSDFGTGKWFLARLSPVYDRNGDYTHRISGSITDITKQRKYADALKENQELLLEAQGISKTGNWWYDYITKETYWSESLYNILEVEDIRDEKGKYEYYLSLIHPDDRENAREFFSSHAGNTETEFEHKLITPKGNLKYFKALRGKLVTDENGKPKRSFGVLQDITQAKLSEKKLKSSQASLEEAQSIAKIGNWRWDVILNRLVWSDEIYNIFEVDPATVTENNFIKLLARYAHPGDRAILRSQLKDLSKITNTSYEYRIITPKGNTKYVSIIVGKLIRREDGVLRKIVGTLQDVTERKQAELGQKRAEDKYRLILESVKMLAISVDRFGNVIFCNRYAADMLGYEPQEILGQNWLESFVPANSHNNTTELFDNESFKPQNINSIICRNGEQRLISWQNTISYDENGEIKEVTGIGEDITERQRKTDELISAKEQAERSSKFKSEFLSIMSHEIRTPMNAVIGTTNLLLSEEPKPEQLEYLNTLKFSGENLLAIINDILDYNKIEAGKLELNRIPFNIHHLTHKIKKSFYAKAVEKNLDLDLRIYEGIPAQLIGDPVRLGQVLNNLVSNAIKFTHIGKVSIGLELLHINRSHATIRFSVTDTGIGIARENLHIIFDPFEQETQHTDTNYGGTGLGLAITKRLVELHNSSISVDSEVGAGTEFSFNISFAISSIQEPKIERPSNEHHLVENADLQGMRVLLVDDNKMNLLIASKFLKKWHAQADEANSGQQAVEMARQNNYDLIIMDLQMPGMDGFEATRIIKSANPHIPVFALTADAMPETNAKAFASGMCDYLTKPFVPQILFEKVAKYYMPVEE